jgi:Baseplate J-like protein
MFNVDDRPETLHVYVVREEAPRPQLFPILLSSFALLVLAALCTLLPYQQPVLRTTLRIPAVPLYLKDFHTSVQIVPTGVKTYPATTAHGVLTITNGSIIGQSIPVGFPIQGVETDGSVYVPGGSANGYGWAQVSAHAVNAGQVGNLPAYAINSVIGSSIYIRNLTAFTGGRDTYSVKIVTAQDKQTAANTAYNILATEIIGLHYPCKEAVFVDSHKNLNVTLHCQFVTYSAPSFIHVTSARLIGNSVIVSGWFTALRKQIWVK